MIKHTPGPWLHEGTTVYALNDCRRPHNRLTVSVMPGWTTHTERTPPAEVEASVCLIAAAPELLALLQETLKPGAYGLGSTLASRIAAAVAKATGDA